MITIWANVDTKILEFIGEFAYYKFIIIDECNEWVFIKEAESCGETEVFLLNWNLPAGVYKMLIFGLNTEEQETGEYIKTEQIKVINPEGFDYNSDVLVDEFNYPLQDENFNDLTGK